MHSITISLTHAVSVALFFSFFLSFFFSLSHFFFFLALSLSSFVPTLPLSPSPRSGRVKLSNIHAVIANNASANPTALEAKIRADAAKRQLTHQYVFLASFVCVSPLFFFLMYQCVFVFSFLFSKNTLNFLKFLCMLHSFSFLCFPSSSFLGAFSAGFIMKR
jgi:hypothetical protein